MGYHSAIGDMDSLERYWNMIAALLALERGFPVFGSMQLDRIYFEPSQSRHIFALIAIEFPPRE
jgi:hypothetical protein